MENSQSVFLHSWGQVCVKYYKWNVGWTMKSRNRFLVFTLTVVLALCTAVQAAGSTGTNEKQTVSSIVQMIPTAVDMKETDGPGNLYALSAVLMDGDSGRVLYEKEGYTARPNASTTKVMTCILALECCLSARDKAEPERGRAVLFRRSSLFFNAEKPQ